MSLVDYLNQRTLVLTSDGRILLGTLLGFDQTANLVLSNTMERLFSAEEAVEEVPMGVYVLRGENVAMVCGIDEEADAAIHWKEMIAEPLRPCRVFN